MLDNLQITSDSTCDLPVEIIMENNIKISPLTVIIGNEEFIDAVNINSEKVLELVAEKGKLPKTSAVSIEYYKKFFKQFTDKGLKVLHFCISSKDSCCYPNACKAAEDMKGVYIVDSYTLSAGQGLLVLKAIDLLKKGKTLEEVYDYINSIKKYVQTSFIIDTLEFLHKGGRCSSLALISSRLMKIHPSIAIKDGALAVKKKYIGSLNRCAVSYLNDTLAEYKNYDKTRCFVIHSPCDIDLDEMFTEKVKELFDFETVIDAETGSTVTSHCGRGTIGLMFINNTEL